MGEMGARAKTRAKSQTTRMPFETTLGHLENKSGAALRQLRDHMVTTQVTTGVAYICPAGSVWPFLLENSFM